MIRREGDVLIDENNNRASIDYFGSEEAARKALESLKGCTYCTDCNRCAYCTRCDRCYGCSGCSGCSDCTRCSGCYGCYGCSNLTNTDSNREVFDVPVIKDIHQAIYAAASREGALDMGAFHECETTHCRAGWAIHLAGEKGYELERKTSSVFAAMQIYKASGYRISPTKFFVSNQEALEDMKRLAEGGGEEGAKKEEGR